jgi:hypothetical protein
MLMLFVAQSDSHLNNGVLLAVSQDLNIHFEYF